MKIEKLYSAVAFIFLVSSLGGCSDDEWQGNNTNGDFIVQLHIPNVKLEEIQTRNTGDVDRENAIRKVLAVVAGPDGLRAEDCTNQQIDQNMDGQATLTLRDIHPLSGDTLHLFCNSSFSKSDIEDLPTGEELLKTITVSNSLDDMPMYGSVVVAEAPSVKLKRAYVKTSVKLDDGILENYHITNWGIYHLPSKTYMAEGRTGYPIEANFSGSVTADISKGDSCVYSVERIDNASADLSEKTCICVQLNEDSDNLGWYRLDFYNENKYMPLNRNTNYRLTITSVKSNGYETFEEAIANPGSNIEYDFEVTDDWNYVYSNGQYILRINKDNIQYATSQMNTEMKNMLTVQAVFSEQADYGIKTYTAEVLNGGGKIDLIYKNKKGQKVNLLTDGDSKDEETKSLGIQISGILPVDCYIELKLGNMVKQIPFQLVTANCYIVNFNEVGAQAYIPIIQANKDGNIRINDTDNIDASLLWSDSPNPPLTVTYDPDKKSILITNNSSFIGNVVVAAKVNNVIRWSWHVWALPEDAITGSSGAWDIKNTYIQNDRIWMDRNLGAVSAEVNDLLSRGFLYQWGRKDPFPPYKEWNMTEGTVSDASIPIYLNGSEAITNMQTESIMDGENNLEYSIKYPMKNLQGIYHSIHDHSEDWYTDSKGTQNNYLWNSIKGQKTAYDPCPIGWKVPVSSYLGATAGLTVELTDRSSGSGFVADIDNQNVFFPNVAYFQGASTDIGHIPHYDANFPNASYLWMATVAGYTTRVPFGFAGLCSLKVDHEGVATDNCVEINAKAMSLSVRCVRE